jgi:biotin transporter BioY
VVARANDAAAPRGALHRRGARSQRGALALLLYLAEGAVGLPVFAGGAGIAYMLGPTGGYLVSYPSQRAWWAGWRNAAGTGGWCGRRPR